MEEFIEEIKKKSPNIEQAKIIIEEDKKSDAFLESYIEDEYPHLL